MFISKIGLPPSPRAKSAAGYKRMCSAFPSSPLSRFLRALSGLSEEHREGRNRQEWKSPHLADTILR